MSKSRLPSRPATRKAIRRAGQRWSGLGRGSGAEAGRLIWISWSWLDKAVPLCPKKNGLVIYPYHSRDGGPESRSRSCGSRCAAERFGSCVAGVVGRGGDSAGVVFRLRIAGGHWAAAGDDLGGVGLCAMRDSVEGEAVGGYALGLGAAVGRSGDGRFPVGAVGWEGAGCDFASGDGTSADLEFGGLRFGAVDA